MQPQLHITWITNLIHRVLCIFRAFWNRWLSARLQKSPLLMYWRYCSLALSHRNDILNTQYAHLIACCFGVLRFVVVVLGVTEMKIFWQNYHHWLHWNLSFWQLPEQPVMIFFFKMTFPFFRLNLKNGNVILKTVHVTYLSIYNSKLHGQW